MQTNSSIEAWLTGRIPSDWSTVAAPTIVIDREEITITITADEPDLADDASDADRAEAVAGRITGFREDTRDQRIGIARDGEHRFERKVCVGCHRRRPDRTVHPRGGTGDDPPAPARADGARHARRCQRRAFACRRARLVRSPRR